MWWSTHTRTRIQYRRNISVEPFIVDVIDKCPLFRLVFSLFRSLARSFLIYVFTHISSARGDRHNKWTLKGKSYAMTMKTIEDAKCNFHVTSVLQTLRKKLVENVTTSDEILAEQMEKNEKRKKIARSEKETTATTMNVPTKWVSTSLSRDAFQSISNSNK